MKTIVKEGDFEIKAVRVELKDGTYEVRCVLYHKDEKLGVIQAPMSKFDKAVFKLKDYKETVSYPLLSNILMSVEENYNKLNIIQSVKGIGWQYNKAGALIGYAGARYLDSKGLVVKRETVDLPLKSDGMNDNVVLKLNDYLAGNIKRQVLLAIGLSAPICGLLNENLVTAIVGKTSIGKTISENICRSLYAKVFDRTELDFDDTENFITQSLVGNRGVFIAIDDTSLTDKKDFDVLTYRLANGTERGRMQRDLRLGERGTWATSIMISAEKSVLFDGKADLLGKFRRLLEIDVFKGDLFDSAEQAEMINEMIKTNNGTIAYGFVAHVLKNNLVSSLKEQLRSEVASIREVTDSDDSLLNALCYKIAIITLTARLANEAVGFDLKSDEIRDCLLNICEENVRLAREMTDDTLVFNKVYEEFYADISKGADEPTVTVDTVTFKETSKKYYSRLKITKLKDWKNTLAEHDCFIGTPGERVNAVRCYILKRLEVQDND